MIGLFLLALEDEADWQSLRRQEPFLRLIGLHYLFEQYGLEKIGEIRNDEIYTTRTIEETLGIETTIPESYWEKYYQLGLQLPVRIEITNPQDFHETGGFMLGFYPGYRWDSFAVGGLIDYSMAPHHQFGDLGAWGKISTLAGTATLFFEPAIGVGYGTFPEGDKKASLWVGSTVGADFLVHGGLSLIGQIRLDHEGEIILGAGISIDPLTLKKGFLESN